MITINLLLSSLRVNGLPVTGPVTVPLTGDVYLEGPQLVQAAENVIPFDRLRNRAAKNDIMAKLNGGGESLRIKYDTFEDWLAKEWTGAHLRMIQNKWGLLKKWRQQRAVGILIDYMEIFAITAPTKEDGKAWQIVANEIAVFICERWGKHPLLKRVACVLALLEKDIAAFDVTRGWIFRDSIGFTRDPAFDIIPPLFVRFSPRGLHLVKHK